MNNDDQMIDQNILEEALNDNQNEAEKKITSSQILQSRSPSAKHSVEQQYSSSPRMQSVEMISAKKKPVKHAKPELSELEKLNLHISTLQAQKVILAAKEKEEKDARKRAQKEAEKEIALEKKNLRASTTSYQRGKLKESELKQETDEEDEPKEPAKSKAKPKDEPADDDAALFIYFKSLLKYDLEEKD